MTIFDPNQGPGKMTKNGQKWSIWPKWVIRAFRSNIWPWNLSPSRPNAKMTHFDPKTDSRLNRRENRSHDRLGRFSENELSKKAHFPKNIPVDREIDFDPFPARVIYIYCKFLGPGGGRAPSPRARAAWPGPRALTQSSWVGLTNTQVLV